MAKKSVSLWDHVKGLFLWVYSAICRIFSALYRFFELLFQLLKTLLLGVSAFLAASALMVIAFSILLLVMGSLVGLSESQQFQERRERFLEAQFERIDAWQLYSVASREAREQGYRLAELTDQTCEEVADCETPEDYLIRSSCPYESLCLQNVCAVVCPKVFGAR